MPVKYGVVKHSVSDYACGQAHTNGVESFWSMLKPSRKGTFHKLLRKRLNRYVQEFAGFQNFRERHVLERMPTISLIPS